MAGFLELALGKPKKGDSGDDAPPSSKSSDSPARAYAKEAYAAIKDDDEAGFISAFMSAVSASKKPSSDDEESDDHDDY